MANTNSPLMESRNVVTEIGAMPIQAEEIKTGGNARRERLINYFARVTQFLMWPILFIVFHLLFRIRISGKQNFKSIRSPFLIVSNHITFYDSFLFRLALGLWTPHLPLRFMAVSRFKKKFLNLLASIGLIRFVYSLFGVFTVTPGMGINRNLEVAKEIIRVKGNIVVYPEGSIFVGEGVGAFKKGAAVLMSDMNIPAIPVSFRVTGGFIRRTVSVRIGEPISFTNGESVEAITQVLHDKVEGLYINKYENS